MGGLGIEFLGYYVWCVIKGITSIQATNTFGGIFEMKFYVLHTHLAGGISTTTG